MNARLCVLIFAALACGCAATPERTAPAGASSAVPAERQVLVTIHQDAGLPVQLRGAPATRYATRRGYGPSPSVERTLKELARTHGLSRFDGWQIDSIGAYCEVLVVPTGMDVDAVVEALRRDPRVEVAQRMNVFETLTESYDDPYADLQASLAVLEIEDAHRIATGKGVTVAVIDSSVDDRHPDFRRRVSANRDLVADEARAPHGEVHGTAIAGIIVSEVNNQEGIVGIAPDASLVALRACWAPVPGASSATCSTFSLALALETAIRLHAQVINLSLTGPSDPLLAELIDAALGRGVIVVAAAPDAASDDTGFPASHAGVIAAHTATVADSSSRAGLPAPGREILTTTPNAGYGFLSGNSLATAHVSGVVALLLERNPELRAQRLVELLAESRHRSGQDAINACWALAEVTASASCPPPADLAQR